MATETNSAPAAEVPRRRADEILTTLAERLGAHLTVTNVYGSPVERDGVTVIPVATVRFGFGGGGGGDRHAEQEGEGGGAMGVGTPTGYIELKDGRSRFVPVVHPARMVALISAVVLGGMLVVQRGRAARR